MMWRYDHFLPSVLVLFSEVGLSLVVEGELPESCVGTPPEMVTALGRKCPVVRVMMRGVRCGQRTGRWLVKTCRKLSLNSVWMSLTRAAGMSCWAAAWESEA